MNHVFLYFSITLSLLLLSCGKTSTITDDMAAAELAISNEDVVATRDICNGILNRAEKDGIDASQYARLSILYMQLNDRTDNPADIEYAARCYKIAYELSADSAEAYYRSLPVDQEKYVMTLSSIVHTLENPREIPADHDMEISNEEIGHVEDPEASDSI